MKHLGRILLIAVMLFSIHADARNYHPRALKTKGASGSGSGTASADASVKLPIGFPFESSDNSSSSTADVSSSKSNIVYKFDIQEDIGPTVLHQTRNALAEARDMNADYVLIHISSTAGALDAAEDIKNEIVNFGKPVLVYMDNKTIPASELISAAGDSVYMRKGSTAVNTKQVLPKRINPSIADQRKAEKFNSVTITSWHPDARTFVITNKPTSFFSLNESPNAMDAVLYHAGLSDLQVVEYKETFMSKLVDVLLSPVAGFLLIIFFALLLSIQRRTSFPGPTTFVLLITMPFVIYPLYAGGLAKMWELALLLLISGSILILRNRKGYITQLLLVSLAFVFFLCRSGDYFMFVNSSSSLQFGQALIAVMAGGNLLLVLRWIASLRHLRFRSPRLASRS